MSYRIKDAFDKIQAYNELLEHTMVRLNKDVTKRRQRRPDIRGLVRIATAAFLIAGVFLFNMFFVAATHVSLDMNPSVELSINRLGRAIDVYAQNQDGSQVLRDIVFRGKI